MTDYKYERASWVEYRNEVERMNITGINTIGKYSFEGFSQLRNVFISSSVTNIGEGSFNKDTKISLTRKSLYLQIWVEIPFENGQYRSPTEFPHTEGDDGIFIINNFINRICFSSIRNA